MTRKNTPPGFVEPDSVNPRAALRAALSIFTSAGWPEVHARRIVPWLLETLPKCGSTESELSSRTESHLTVLALAWCMPSMEATTTEPSLHRAGVVLLAVLTGCVRTPWLPLDEQDSASSEFVLDIDGARGLVDLLHECGADFGQALRSGWPSHLLNQWRTEEDGGQSARFTRFLKILLATGAVDLVALVDLDRLRSGTESSAFSITFKAGGSQWLDGTDWYEPKALKVWMRHAGAETISTFARFASGEPDATLPELLTSLAYAAAHRFANSEYGLTVEYFGGHSDEMVASMQGFGRAMRPCFEEIDRRIGPSPKAASVAMRSAWMLLFRMAWDADMALCPVDLRARLLTMATEDAARVRNLLSWEKGNPDDEKDKSQAFAERLPYLRRCLSLLAHWDGCWQMMKPILLAMRKLPTCAVARDLRDWAEFADDAPPEPWCALPAALKTYFHATIAREQAKDPDLDALRGEFARFCLERLTDKLPNQKRQAANHAHEPRTEANMREPSAVWRYGHVRAVQDLRSNAEGTGHRTLHWSAEHDPDERVRVAASSAEQVLRHSRALPENVSPRRAILSAFWWLRQAHALELGVEIDPDGAQRTRAKELSRTKEAESAT